MYEVAEDRERTLPMFLCGKATPSSPRGRGACLPVGGGAWLLTPRTRAEPSDEISAAELVALLDAGVRCLGAAHHSPRLTITAAMVSSPTSAADLGCPGAACAVRTERVGDDECVDRGLGRVDESLGGQERDRCCRCRRPVTITITTRTYIYIEHVRLVVQPCYARRVISAQPPLCPQLAWPSVAAGPAASSVPPRLSSTGPST